MNRSSMVLVLSIVGLMVAGTAPCRAARQAFVKVNEFYVFYTMPVVPYIDRRGVFMVGLEGMTRGWTFPDAHPSLNPLHPNITHGTVTYDVPRHTATLSFNGHRLMFCAGTRSVDVDGQSMPMKDTAIWKAAAGQMVVPLTALTTSLHLTTAWDPAQHVLSITGRGLMHDVEGTDYYANVYPENGAAGRIVPVSVHLRLGNPPPSDPDLPDEIVPPGVPWVELIVRNMSGHNIGQARDWINATSLFRGELGLPAIDVDLPPPEVRTGPTPPMPSDSTRTLAFMVKLHWTKFAPLCLICEPLEEPSPQRR